MKKLLFVLFMIVGVGANSQDTIHVGNKQYVSIDTTQLTAKQVYEDAKEGIKGLAAALKQPAEHVYTVLVRQQIVQATIWLILSILSVLLIIFSTRWIKALVKMMNDTNDGFIYFVGVFFLIIVNTVFAVICLQEIDTIITGYINPEYGAIKDIFDFVKGK